MAQSIPNAAGYCDVAMYSNIKYGGCVTWEQYIGFNVGSTTGNTLGKNRLHVNLSQSSSIYQDGANVVPTSRKCKFLIRF